MAYEDEVSRRSRVVVETPNSRREVEETNARRSPEGISAGTVGVIVVLAVALVTILVLLLLSNQPSEQPNDLAAQQQTQPAPVPQTTIVQQPASQPPVIIQQQPAPAPVIITPPASDAVRGPNDATIEAEISRRFVDDTTLSTLAVTATVLEGKVTLDGSVKSETEKALAESAVRSIKGVRIVDNKIVVTP